MASLIDNRIKDGLDNRLVTHINQLLAESEFSRMAVGYFYLSGFEAIRENLNKVQSLRLLIGNRSDQRTVEEMVKGFASKEAIEREIRLQSRQNAQQKKATLDTVQQYYHKEIAHLVQNDDTEIGLRALWELVSEGRIEIRVYTKGFMHSKAYIFATPNRHSKGTAIVGSSNLTISGLSNNAELNIIIRNDNDYIEVNQWFDDLWKISEPFSEEMMEVVKSSWFKASVTPYEIYLKTLYHLVNDRINVIEYAQLTQSVFHLDTLKPFQRDAFNLALSKLEHPEHPQNGVFISDVVGLGKSYIALALISYYWSQKQKSTLIVCPAALKSMWEDYKTEYQLNCRILSTSELIYKNGNETFTLNEEEGFNGYGVVVIDEAHNFRNPDTQRYKILAPYLQDKKVILLTATPQNKSVWDIYYQIKLFHQSDVSDLNISPNNLKKYFETHSEQPEKISELLQHFLIRRTRNDLLNSPKYKDLDLHFPSRVLKTIEYDIDQTYIALQQNYVEEGESSIYQKLVALLFKSEQADRFKYAIYDLSSFLKEGMLENKTYQGLSYSGELSRGLLKTMLFKRLESSVNAFYISIQRMIKRHHSILTFVSERNVVVTGKADQLELLLNFDIQEENDKITTYNIEDFRADELTIAIEDDKKILEEVLSLIQPLLAHPEKDDKFNRFIETIVSKHTDEKILIFSEFTDTVDYLYKRVKKLYPQTEIAHISSKANSEEKAAIVRRFSPISQTKGKGLFEGEKEIQFLFTTDVLSEGQNLQDAFIVVNYDFHWNPVRLIQRIGRVDRIGSSAENIYVYNFLPDAQIEKHLDLRGRVNARINEIHQIFGSDSRILSDDEFLNENSVFAIYADTDAAILDVDSGISTIFDKAERTLLALQQEKPEVYQRISNLEDGVRTCFSTHKQGMYAYLVSGNLHRLYYSNGKEITDNMKDILTAIEVVADTPAKELNTKAHNQDLKKMYDKFKAELLNRQKEFSANQIIPEQKELTERLKNCYTLFQQDNNMKERINKLSLIFSKEIPDYAKNKVRSLKKEKLSDDLLIQAMTDIAEKLNLEDFQSKAKESENMVIKVICSERMEA